MKTKYSYIVKMEPPQWTDKISSETICKFYYIMLILVCVFVTLGIVGIFMSDMTLRFKLIGSLPLLLNGGLLVLSILFMYLMCSRALLKKKEEFRNRY
jgi:protein-S-isoprenylcysteine O-methyltransferase Ste14